MLHKQRVILALYYGLRRRLRIALRIRPRVRPPPVLSQPLEQIVQRHGSIARYIQLYLPPDVDLTGKAVCEVGAGDCLAAASLLLGRGAAHVDIIEVQSPVVNEKQLQVLQRLKADGFPIDIPMVRAAHGICLDEKRVRYHRCFMEDFESENAHELIFSFSVVEHVEDFVGFYASCWKTLCPGGWMLHVVDLSGHGCFEDPLPPLDFQTYPDWLHDLMSPPYYRATRRFFNEHVSAVTNSGFKIHQITATRKAEQGYVDRIRSKLRPAARNRPREELQVLEFVLLARKV